MWMAHYGKRLVIRSFRATYVLAVLFAFSLLYFVVESGLLAWIIQNALSISGVSSDLRSFYDFHVSFNFLSSNFQKLKFLHQLVRLVDVSVQDIEERMLDKYKLTAHRHIQWLADSAGRNSDGVNDSFVSNEGIACRNTIQGRTSVTDDRVLRFPFSSAEQVAGS
ncbi:unnamed protein product, partial [Onchocerca flexuosa]|uniref:Autophagy-related protein 9 n=1 Tax=Onchocerca flexuosa TaxID=387005 RepID=A0A183HEP7_9BILA